MSFSPFQTATATLKKVTTDGFGDETFTTYTVNIDPVFGYKRMNDDEGEIITGLKTVLTADNLQFIFDLSHKDWKLDFNGQTYELQQPVPFYTIGTNNLEHIEVVLR